MATRGSIPKARAVSAELMAMVASSSGVGFSFTAQSPYTSTLSGRHMKNTLDSQGVSGRVCTR